MLKQGRQISRKRSSQSNNPADGRVYDRLEEETSQPPYLPLSFSRPDLGVCRVCITVSVGGGCAYAGCTQGAVPHAKKAGSIAPLPARSVMKSFDAKAVCLGTDSVNPFRQQIYKSLVSVALKSQTAKPPGVDTDGFAFSPVNAFGAAFSGGCRTGARPDQKSIQLRPLTFYGNSTAWRCWSRSAAPMQFLTFLTVAPESKRNVT